MARDVRIPTKTDPRIVPTTIGDTGSFDEGFVEDPAAGSGFTIGFADGFDDVFDEDLTVGLLEGLLVCWVVSFADGFDSSWDGS